MSSVYLFLATFFCCGPAGRAFVPPSLHSTASTLLVSTHSTRRARRSFFFRASLTQQIVGDDNANQPPLRWLQHGLLLSSFSDGLVPNPDAQEFLFRGLVERLWMDRQALVESQVSNSAVQSPCCGPNTDALDNLERTDHMLEELRTGRTSWRDAWTYLRKQQQQPQQQQQPPLEIRVLYIPTAMYALRQDSANTPGKQRQRARADGKKRRNEIVQLLQSQLGGNNDNDVTYLAVTLDLDDASVKQPEGSKDPSRFPPKTGKEAITKWKPHLIYVQGGNTFWLHHCIEKGDWAKDLVEALCCNNKEGKGSSVYCGTSAGAIIMGQSMETACWKGWDDPSVVPGRESYSDWKGVRGFGLAGQTSFFPHMTDDWIDLVEEKKPTLLDQEVYLLRDEDCVCVDGRSKSLSFVSAAQVPAEQPVGNLR